MLYRSFLRGTAAACVLALAGCATSTAPEGPPAPETVWAVTATQQLVKFNAGQPGRVLERRAVTGLAAGETLVGIDFRVARGVLYALGSRGQLYTLDTATGALARVGAGVAGLPVAGTAVGFDFNPAVDRIRVATAAGANLRLHPDTGAQVDGDANATGVQNDAALADAAGPAPKVLAAAYTYNKKNDKLTTNFAIDGRAGTLVTQGTREGAEAPVSPNTGRLFTVGALGTGALDDASFDIADLNNAAYAAVRRTGEAATRWLRIDLATGRATVLGTLGDGTAVVGIAIEP
jgi:Domain of unknown function (DUF4394)